MPTRCSATPRQKIRQLTLTNPRVIPGSLDTQEDYGGGVGRMKSGAEALCRDDPNAYNAKEAMITDVSKVFFLMFSLDWITFYILSIHSFFPRGEVLCYTEFVCDVCNPRTLRGLGISEMIIDSWRFYI